MHEGVRVCAVTNFDPVEHIFGELVGVDHIEDTDGITATGRCSQNMLWKNCNMDEESSQWKHLLSTLEHWIVPLGYQLLHDA